MNNLAQVDKNRSEMPIIDKIILKNDAPPINDLEKDLASIWSDVLAIDKRKISREHNFFKIGGHRLAAIQVAQNISSKFNQPVSVQAIIDNPSIAEFSSLLLKSHKISKQYGLSPKKNNSKTKTSTLLHGQFISWFFQCYLKAKTSNVCGAYILTGQFGVELFQYALNEVAKHHDSLWYPFSKKKPLMSVEKAGLCHVDVTDLSSLDDVKQDLLAKKAADGILHGPFDLSKTPHLRVSIFKQKTDKHLLLISLPHIVSDYGSLNDFIIEVFEEYQRIKNPIEQLEKWRKTTALEMVNFENDYFQSKEYHKSQEFWIEKLASAKMPKLEKKYFLAKGKPTDEKLLTKIKFPENELDALQRIAKQTNTSIPMIVFALIHATIGNLTAQNNITIGMVFDTRGVYVDPPVINLNTKTIVIRSNLSITPTYLELLNQIKWEILDAHGNLQYPNIATISVDSYLNGKPLLTRLLKGLTFLWSRRFGKSPKERQTVASLITSFVGLLALQRSIKKENKGFMSAPPMLFNVMPNFYENRALWTDDHLSVTDLREREFIMNPMVFNKNSAYMDARALNFELLKENENDVFLYVWGGGLNSKAFSVITTAFSRHLNTMLSDLSNPINYEV